MACDENSENGECPVMGVNELIISALEGFGDPVQHGTLIPDDENRNPKMYYTFNYTTHPTGFADNAPGYEKYLIQVHFFCPHNFNTLIRTKKTKRALYNVGMTWPSVIHIPDGYGQHIVYECEYIERIPDGED